ncbi:uncharacterized membrane protein YjjP (DUF1212 family) [Rhizobium sp. 1399]|nr:uncharacterized membrane protein YjjP (DUF1212 family) [Rhizobium sp. 1399]
MNAWVFMILSLLLLVGGELLMAIRRECFSSNIAMGQRRTAV